MKQENIIVEYDLTASEFNWEIKTGKHITAWRFCHQVPGPILRAKKGDTLIVRVQNNLPDSTRVHWQGIRLPATQEGTGEEQHPIPGESLEYRIILPEDGTFWDHSHQNETVPREKGMYGGIDIKDYTDPAIDKESVLVSSDMKLKTVSRDILPVKTYSIIDQWNIQRMRKPMKLRRHLV